MPHLSLVSKLEITHLNDLTPDERAMVDAACDMTLHAYAPYSNFYVGAAVMTDDGGLYGGSNQENASYPLCMCGERVALYHKQMAAPDKKIVSIAITAKNPKLKMTQPVMPCGACRQVLVEYEQRNGSDIKLYFKDDEDRVYIALSAKSLLPFGFDASFLF